MRHASLVSASLTCLAMAVPLAAQQEIPTEQPGYLKIYMEEVKLGHATAYEQTSSGWPKAQERAGYSGTYLALQSMTGPDMVWYVEPFASYTEDAMRMKEIQDNRALSTELQRLWDAHGEHLESARTVQLVARPGLSNGSFPDLTNQRFWDITVFRVKPGGGQGFEAAARKYGELAGPDVSYRVYEVMSGMPSGTFLVFSSVADYSEWDQRTAQSRAMWENVSEDDMQVFMDYGAQSEASTVTYRFRLSPTMSYVPAEMKAADPDFWNQN